MVKRALFFGSLMGLFLSFAHGAAKDAPFRQEAVTRYTWEQLGATEIAQAVVDGQNQLWLLAKDSLWVLEGEKARRVDQRLSLAVEPGMRLAAYPHEKESMAIAGPKGLYRYSPRAKIVFKEFAFGNVHDLTVTSLGEIWIASEKGLWVQPRGSVEIKPVSEVKGPVTAMAWGEKTLPAAGTAQALYCRETNRWSSVFVGGLIDKPITAMQFDAAGTLWIGNVDCVNRLHPDGTFDRISGLQGLPYNRIIAMTCGKDGEMWFGTEKGACRYAEGSWKYYYGPRWHWGESIRSIAAQSDGTVWLVSDKGLSKIQFAEWTLRRKADHYESMVRPRHDRFGLTADCSLKTFGDLNTYVQHDSDNDGLWTSIYLAAECFRYAVTKDPEAKKNAWHSFEAMERLEKVTGVPGFFARSYVKKGVQHENGEWHDSADGAWTWKGDTSSDEMVGHLFVYPLVYDLLAETDAEKQRVRALVSEIMNYVVDHGYYLNDLDGKPTTWGVWAPEKLNDDPKEVLESGLNSLQMLSFLTAAHHVTGEEKFLRAFNELAEKHGYAKNMLNQKIETPADNNHSDDELAFLPYYILFCYTKGHPLRSQFQLSIDRSWKIEKLEKSSLWNVIYRTSDVPSESASPMVEDALRTLRRWPLELIDWPTPNSHRLDIRINPDYTRSNQKQSIEVLPPDERRVMRWNGNPFELDGGSGFGEDDPGAWLLPYWMARYHGLIE